MQKRNTGAKVQYRNPFDLAFKASRGLTDFAQKSQAEDVAKAKFAERMSLDNAKFGEIKSQNQIANQNAAARLGIAQAAAARAGQGLNWQQKRQYLEREDARRMKDGTYYKGRPAIGKSSKYSGTTIPSDVSKNMKENDLTALRQMEANMYADGASKADVAAATADRTEAVSGFNLFNYNDYGLTDRTF